MKYNVFISYSRKDKQTVETFCKSFDNVGITYWMDRTGIDSGDAFRRVIVQAIEDCEILVFFASENANKSEWTEKEINTAVYFKKPIIPVRLDKSQYNKSVLFELAGLDFIDYTIPSLHESVIARLVDTIKKKVATDDTKMSTVVEIENPTSAQKNQEVKKHSKPKTAYFSKDVKIAVILQMLGLSALIALFGALFFYTNTISQYPLLRIEDALIIADLLAMMYCTYKIKDISWCKWSFLVLDAVALLLLYVMCSKYMDIVESRGFKWANMSIVHQNLYLIGATKPGLALFYCTIIYALHNLCVYVIMNSRVLWQKLKTKMA